MSSSSSISSDSDDSSQSSSDSSSDSSSSGSGIAPARISSKSAPPQAAAKAPLGKIPMTKLVAPRPGIGQPLPPPAPKLPNGLPSKHSHKTSNPQLVYTHRDADMIPHPAPPFGAYGSLIGLIYGDRQWYPLRRYRYVDYLITAMDMFLAVVQDENAKQVESAAKAGREQKKFTWGNKGELAICYTLTCDMLKILHDKLAAPKPKWETVVEELTSFMMRTSQIPTDILTEKTYKNKYLDWKKGGTRYNADDHSNVRFPSAEERLKKLETRIRTGDVYEVQSTVVEAPLALIQVPAVHHPATPSSSASHEQDGGKPGTTSQPPPGPGPLANRTKVPPHGTASFKQPHELSKPFHWISELNAIKGNANLILLPRDRVDKMPSLINVCAKCDTAEQFCIIADLISQSPVDVQVAFEAQGGLVFVKRWLCSCMRTKNEAAVRTLAERTVSMKLRAWSAKTRAAWHNGCINLDWLRGAEFIGMKPQLWQETVLRLEQLAMSPSELPLGGATKRTRDGDPVEQAAEEMKSFGSSLVVHTMDRAIPLPHDLRFDPLQPATLNSLEASQLCALLERRRSFAAHMQKVLCDRVVATGGTAANAAPIIPLLFDPFSLLGVPRLQTLSLV